MTRLIDTPAVASALIGLYIAKRQYREQEIYLSGEGHQGSDMAYYLERQESAVEAAEAALESALQEAVGLLPSSE